MAWRILPLDRKLRVLVTEPGVAQRLIAQGTDPQSSTPEGVAEFLRADFERQRKVIASAGIADEQR